MHEHDHSRFCFTPLFTPLFTVVFTVVFTRLLGQTDYGTLAALISAFLILLVAGQSVQLAAAREAALDRLGHPEVLRATLRAWTRQLLGRWWRSPRRPRSCASRSPR